MTEDEAKAMLARLSEHYGQAPPRRKSFIERIASATIDWLDDVAEERDAKRSRGST